MAQVKVATLNLHNRFDRWMQRRHLIVSELLDSSPHLISLQEVHIPSGQGRWLRNQLNARMRSVKRDPYTLKQKHHWSLRNQDGVAILSRLPVIATDSISLGHGRRAALRTHVMLPSRQTLDFIAVHLLSGYHDSEKRHEQVLRLLGWLNKRLHTPLQIIAGDFNDEPHGIALQQMRQWYRSVFAEKHGYDPLATYPTQLVPTDGWAGCLDYIFISSAVTRVRSAQVFCTTPSENDDTLYPSDHVGLLCALDL